jgi:hypothetical protein
VVGRQICLSSPENRRSASARPYSFPRHRITTQAPLSAKEASGMTLFWRELADIAQKVIVLLLGTYSKLATLPTYPVIGRRGIRLPRFVSAAGAH